MGPIATDTLFETYGIITSGLLPKEQSLALLMIGPEYEQVVIKSVRAAERLRWISAEELGSEECARCSEALAREEAEYQRAFAARLERLGGYELHHPGAVRRVFDNQAAKEA